jgi:hypothetical protein
MSVQTNIIYPVYRKYPHGKTFFKISSESEFEELQIIGSHYSITTLVAKILPERNYIYDLTFAFEGLWEVIGQEEYILAKNNCINNLKKI